MLSNAYFLAKFRFDTAENEPNKNLQNGGRGRGPRRPAARAARGAGPEEGPLREAARPAFPSSLRRECESIPSAVL